MARTSGDPADLIFLAGHDAMDGSYAQSANTAAVPPSSAAPHRSLVIDRLGRTTSLSCPIAQCRLERTERHGFRAAINSASPSGGRRLLSSSPRCRPVLSTSPDISSLFAPDQPSHLFVAFLFKSVFQITVGHSSNTGLSHRDPVYAASSQAFRHQAPASCHTLSSRPGLV